MNKKNNLQLIVAILNLFLLQSYKFLATYVNYFEIQ